jgi:acyl carrier protein
MDPHPAPVAAASESERLLSLVQKFLVETHPSGARTAALDSHLERDLGLDSLARVELLLRAKDELRIEVPDALLNEIEHVGDMLRFISHGNVVHGSGPAAKVVHARDTEYPSKATTLIEVLDWHAERHPDQVYAVIYGENDREEELTFGALRDEARAVGRGLIAGGVQRGQTVALMLPTGREYLATFFGVLMACAVPVPIYPPVRLAQVEDHLKRHSRILANAGSVVIVTIPQAKPLAMLLKAAVPSLKEIVTEPDLVARARNEPLPVPVESDLAFIQYTSGSTGEPKGVALTHANLLVNVRMMGRRLEVSSKDVFVSWLPLYHDMGLIGAGMGSLIFGMLFVLMSPLAFLGDPARWLRAISRHGGTLSGGPNFAYELVAARVPDAQVEGLDLSSWRVAFNGAEPVNPETMRKFWTRFAPQGFRRESLQAVYGLAESSLGVAFPTINTGTRIDTIDPEIFASGRRAVPILPDTPGGMRIPACGHALHGHEIRVVDEFGVELPERHVGKLEFKGPSVMQGYYGNPEATAKVLRDGWCDSGDYAYMADGAVYITGREKDLIIRGGRNVYPYDIEQAAGNVPGIRKGCVAVFGVPDVAQGTEKLVVLAETREKDLKAREALRAAINQAAIEVTGLPPDEVVLAPPHTVLKTSSGKIRRSACRDVYLSGTIGRGGAPLVVQLARVTLSVFGQRAMAFMRGLGHRLYGIWAWSMLAVLIVPLWLVGVVTGLPALMRPLTKVVARLFLLLTGLSARTTGLDRIPQGAHALVANHTSFLDAVVLIAYLPASGRNHFVAKREYAGPWWIRRFFQSEGVVFVERQEAKQLAEDAEAMVSLLVRGDSLIIFPEGSLERVTGLRPFRSGVFIAAAKAGVPVVPVGLDGLRSVLRDGTWWPRRAPVALEVGNVLLPHGADWAAASRLRDVARTEVLRMAGEPDLAEFKPR